MLLVNNMRKYFLEVAVFVCGFSVMVFELVGSRIFAPYLGTSLYVWTSIIGVILGSLSLGYWWGGRLADRGATARFFSMLIALAALFLLIVVVFKFAILVTMSVSTIDLRLRALLSAVLIFSPTSVALGMISPYAVRLKVQTLAAAGQVVGNLYALSTLGSITGTFIAGFFLIAYVGTTNILLILALILFCTSLFVFWGDFKKIRIAGTALVILSLVASNLLQGYVGQNAIVADVDTNYNRFQVVESIDAATNRPTLNLVSSREATQAGMFMDNDDDLVYPYSKFYRLGDFFNPNIKQALMIGGGAYSYPKDFLKKHQNAHLDVVEIDPGVTFLAEQYFNLKPSANLTIYHQDGRAFLNQLGAARYDAIYGDAFHSYFDVPFQLTTVEAVQKIASHLTDTGVYIVNINSALGGERSKFLLAETATLEKVFPQVYRLPVTSTTDQDLLQNIMLVALKSSAVPDWSSATGTVAAMLGHLQTKPLAKTMPILTDDYAPIENYILPLVKK